MLKKKKNNNDEEWKSIERLEDSGIDVKPTDKNHIAHIDNDEDRALPVELQIKRI